MTSPARQTLPYPDPDDVDAAPQLLIVALADAALFGVQRALDSAHPVLAAIKRHDRKSPLLLATDRLAIHVLDATADLAALLRDYADAVRFDIEDFHDPLDPF
jgi:hypothetical protein